MGLVLDPYPVRVARRLRGGRALLLCLQEPGREWVALFPRIDFSGAVKEVRSEPIEHSDPISVCGNGQTILVVSDQGDLALLVVKF